MKIRTILHLSVIQSFYLFSNGVQSWDVSNCSHAKNPFKDKSIRSRSLASNTYRRSVAIEGIVVTQMEDLHDYVTYLKFIIRTSTH